MRKILGGLALAAGLALGLAGQAVAQTKSLLQTVQERGTVRVGTTGDYAPYTIRNLETGGFSGYDIDVANALAADLGVKVEFVQTTWPTLVAGMVANKYDIAAAGITITLDRLKSVSFSEPYLKPLFVPIIDKKDAGRFKTWKDLDQEGVTIALQMGTAPEEAVKRRFKKAKLVSVAEPVIDYTEVLAGRATATVTDNLYFASVIGREYPQLATVDEGNPVQETYNGLMTVQGDQVWLNWVNAWVREKQSQGFFEELHKKWFVDYKP
ncbi:MAG TPA: transporter substrate-binding domain-containing protein [Alphaproteobacteria bacterium]|nr:transporter substrate-binding domain-containing protein [Alphaproteobacteria bacterium]